MCIKRPLARSTICGSSTKSGPGTNPFRSVLRPHDVVYVYQDRFRTPSPPINPLVQGADVRPRQLWTCPSQLSNSANSGLGESRWIEFGHPDGMEFDGFIRRQRALRTPPPAPSRLLSVCQELIGRPRPATIDRFCALIASASKPPTPSPAAAPSPHVMPGHPAAQPFPKGIRPQRTRWACPPISATPRPRGARPESP